MTILKEITSKKRFYILGFLENFVVIADVKDGQIRRVTYDSLQSDYTVRMFGHG